MGMYTRDLITKLCINYMSTLHIQLRNINVELTMFGASDDEYLSNS